MSTSVIFLVQAFLHPVIDKPRITSMSCVHRYWCYSTPICNLGELLGNVTVPMRFFCSTVGFYVSCFASVSVTVPLFEW